MKKKELKKIAEQIAYYEKILQNSEDNYEKHEAQEAILDLTRRVDNIDDMSFIDDYVQEYLKN